MSGVLVLEDGTVLEGHGIGASGTVQGEVVFNTGMTGYQEILTDPSYCRQLVVMTYPLIGNYGINPEDFQSYKPHLRGFIVREWCEKPNHWQASTTLEDYLWAEGIVGLAGIDTRALTRHLRDQGTMAGVIVTGEEAKRERGELVELAQETELRGLVEEVTTPKPYHIFGNGPRITLVDLGVKQSVLNYLLQQDFDITVVPANWNAEQIMRTRPDGVLLSNGPGNPEELPGTIEVTRNILGTCPMFGICLGHQVLALALGASSYKLTFGHRGANHPVKELATGRVYITSQNHGYAIDEASLADLDVEITHRNLNDGTVEGLKHNYLPVSSVQYHPEAGPGPRDSEYVFEQLNTLLRQQQPVFSRNGKVL